MKNIFKNKLLYILIFFVFILAIYFLTNSVFADDSNTFVFHNNIIDKDVTVIKPSDLPEDYKYTLIVTNDLTSLSLGYEVGFIFSNTPVLIDVRTSDNDRFSWGFTNSIGDGLGFYFFNKNSRYFSSNGYSSTKFDLSNNFSFFSYYENGFLSSAFSTDNISTLSVAYANHDIYDNTGNLLFQGAPVVEQITIPEIQSVEEIPQAMVEVLKILIPIGLIIFGIGLLIYLVQSLTSRVT